MRLVSNNKFESNPSITIYVKDGNLEVFDTAGNVDFLSIGEVMDVLLSMGYVHREIKDIAE